MGGVQAEFPGCIVKGIRSVVRIIFQYRIVKRVLVSEQMLGFKSEDVVLVKGVIVIQILVDAIRGDFVELGGGTNNRGKGILVLAVIRNAGQDIVIQLVVKIGLE